MPRNPLAPDITLARIVAGTPMKLLAFWIVLAVGGVLDQRLSAQTTQTYEVTANIDVADLLLIRANTLQWHHPGSGVRSVDTVVQTCQPQLRRPSTAVS